MIDFLLRFQLPTSKVEAITDTLCCEVESYVGSSCSSVPSKCIKQSSDVKSSPELLLAH